MFPVPIEWADVLGKEIKTIVNEEKPMLRRSEDGVIPYTTYEEWEKNRL